MILEERREQEPAPLLTINGETLQAMNLDDACRYLGSLYSSSKPLQIYTLLFWRLQFVQRHFILYYSVWPIPRANLSHYRVQKFAITTITDEKPINRWGKPIHSVFPPTCSCFTTGKDAKKLITCIIVVSKNASPIDCLSVHIFAGLFRALQAPCGVESKSGKTWKYSTNLHNP